MRVLSPSTWGLLAVSAVALSSVLTWASIRYARNRQMIDHPGQRRSHAVPTPRGGGIGMVVAVIAGLVVMAVFGRGDADFAVSTALVASILMVAGAGWIDDHRGLGAALRLLAHGIAACLLGLPALALLLPGWGENPATPWIAIAMLICTIGIVASINLHNFMDGIDGLLAMQALFVFCVLAWVCHQAGRLGEAQHMGLFAAAVLGFLPFNFPRARIFMGDVGSGTLGLLIAVAVFWQMAAVPGAIWVGFIASSAFLVDSTMTLGSRVIGGRRWYSAHREHLYQWLVRAGFSHARVVGIYAGWNLMVALPVILWGRGNAAGPSEAGLSSLQESWATTVVMVLAVVLWLTGKRWCLRATRRGSRIS